MGTGDKAENKAQELGGQAKETMGDATDNDRLRREGRADQSEANAKQAGEKIKDAAGNVKDALTGGDRDRT